MAVFIPTENPDGRPTLALSGEVDIAAVDELIEAARACLDRAVDGIDIDLGGVTFIDSSGLGALVRIRNVAAERGLGIELVHVPRSVQRLFDLTGLEAVFSANAEE